MYKVLLYNNTTMPFATMEKKTEELAIELAKSLLKGEDATWRAEVWAPDGRMVYCACPPVD